jgi:hypothetical protein
MFVVISIQLSGKTSKIVMRSARADKIPKIGMIQVGSWKESAQIIAGGSDIKAITASPIVGIDIALRV